LRLDIQKITVQYMLYIFRLWWDLIFQKITTLHMCVRIHFILCMVIFSVQQQREYFILGNNIIGKTYSRRCCGLNQN